MRKTIHEMRNQLAVAVANIEAIMDGKLAPTPDRLASVLNALSKLDILMNELPTATKPLQTMPNMQPVDVCALIASETVAIEASASAAGITLESDCCKQKHPACSRFTCDETQVSQVVKNVLLNAIKFTGHGGHVKISCQRDRGELALEISDDGPGVPVAERQAIFERGMRGSAAAVAAGSGVGLAVVRDILDAHGGTVNVDDSASGGARFVIRLPGDATGAQRCGGCRECAPDVAAIAHD